MSEVTGTKIVSGFDLSDDDRKIKQGVVSGAISLAQPGANVPAVEGMSTWDSFGTAVGEWSTVYAIGAAGADISARPDFYKYDEPFIMGRPEWEKANPQRQAELKEMRDVQLRDPIANEFLSNYENALNPQAAEFWLERYQLSKELRTQRKESGGAGYVLGAISGVLIDAIILNVGAGPALAATARAAATNAIKYAAPELAVDALARDLYDPTFTSNDIIMQGLVGIPAAGLVGAGIHKIMRPAKPFDDEAVKQSIDDYVRRGDNRDGGAAAVEGFTDMPVNRSGGDSADLGVISRVLDAPAVNTLRGPKGILKTLRKAVSGRYAELEEIISSFDLVWKSSELTEGVRRGETFQGGVSMEEGINLMRAELQVHLRQSDEAIDGWMDKAYGKVSRIIKSVSDFLPGKAPSRYEIKELASKLSVAQDNATKYDSKITDLESKIDRINDALDKAESRVAEGIDVDTGVLKSQLEMRSKQLMDLNNKKGKAAGGLDELRGQINQRGVDAEDAEGFNALISHLSQTRDAEYLKMGKRLGEAGLIEPENIRPGYRPQQWNAEAIRENPVEFKAMLWDALAAKGPDEEFIDDILSEMGKGDEIAARTMDDLIEENPSVAGQIQEAFEDTIKDNIEDRLQRAISDLNAEFGERGRKAAQAFVTKADTQITKYQDLVQESQMEWDNLIPEGGTKPVGRPVELERAWRNLARNETRLQEWSVRRDLAQQMLNGERSLEDLYSRMSRDLNKHTDDTFREATAKLGAAQKGLEKAALRAKVSATLSKRVHEMYTNLADNKGMRTFESDEYLQTTAHAKRRSIDLSGVQHTDKWQKYLRDGDDDILTGYAESVSRQALLEEKMGAFLRDQGDLDEGSHDVVDAWLAWATRKVDAAIEANPDQRSEMLKFKLALLGDSKSNGMMGKALKEFTRQDRLDQFKSDVGGWQDTTLGITSTAVNAMVLGRVAITLPTDLATTAAGGQRFLTGFKAIAAQLLMGNWLGGIKNIRDKDAILAMTIEGEHIVSASDMAARVDADNFMMTGPGTMGRKIEKSRQVVGAVSSWSNFMTPWNKFVRSSVGLDAAAEIIKDASRRHKMSKGLRAAYASAGLGDDVTRGINDLDAIAALTKVGGTIRQSHAKVADTTSWGDMAVVFENGVARAVKASEVPDGAVSVSGAHVQQKYLSAVRTFANQMHLDPAIGDRPFWSKSIHGRIFMAMQSFMYASADRFVQPAIERISMDKVGASARFMGASMLGIGLGAVGQSVRDSMAERDTAFTKDPAQWSGEDAWEIVRVGFRRSPLSIGALDRFWEAASVGAGDHINDAIGVKLVDETPVKYRHNGNIAASLAGVIPGTVVRAGKMASSPESVTADQMIRITPLLNSLWFQALMSIYE